MGNGAAIVDFHPDVRGHLASAARRAATTVKQQIEHSAEAFPTTHRELESPAEAIFAAWFLALARTLPHRFELVPQHEVVAGGQLYRLDFRILPADVLALHEADVHHLAFPPLAVEVDGHEWHERTRQQVTSRNRRDRDLQAGRLAGVPLLGRRGRDATRSVRHRGAARGVPGMGRRDPAARTTEAARSSTPARLTRTTAPGT